MPKTIGDYYRNPKSLWRYRCPICNKTFEEVAENPWDKIYSHIWMKHKEQFEIEEIERWEYRAKLGWIRVYKKEE
jgi:transposase-like protein